MATQSTMAAAEPNASKEPLSWGDIILSGPVFVKVGPEEKQYHVHKALIVHHSDYFRNAFNGSWKESEENCSSLKDVETTIFEVFVRWLYRPDLPLTDEVCRILGYYPQALRDLDFTSDGEKGQDAPFLTLTKAVVFGDRFLSPRFSRAANNALVDFVIDNPPRSGVVLLSAAQYAHENLPADSKTYQFILEALHAMLDDMEVTNLVEEMTEKRDMSSLLLARLLEKFNSIKLNMDCRAWWHRCRHHEHANHEEWNNCLTCDSCGICDELLSPRTW